MTPSDSHGQRRERGPEASEDDPTGIRDLLASLPDPGPMPEDLVQRIGARLAVEQAHRAQASSAGLAARSDTVVDLAAERSHRRPGRTVAMLGVAAAGLLVATVAIGELAGFGPAGGPSFDTAAQVPTRSAAGADSGGGDQGSDSAGGEDQEDSASDGGLSGADAPNEGSADADDGLGPLVDEDLGAAGERDEALDDGAGSGAGGLPGSADVVVLPDLGVVSSGDYRERVLELVTDEDAGAAAADGLLTQAGAESCWESVVPDQAWPTLHAAQAEMEGDRVVVLVGLKDAVVGEAAVLPWACTEGGEVDPITSIHWGY